MGDLERFCIVAAAVAIAACGGGTVTGTEIPPAGQSQDAAAGRAQVPDASAPPGPLCDGSPGIRFYASRTGGGMRESGAELSARNGLYFVVTGDCRAFCSTGEGLIYSSALDAAEASSIRTAYGLDAAPSWSGDFVDGRCDAPSDIFGFEGHRLDVRAACHSTTNVPGWVGGLRTALADSIQTCSTMGAAWTGDVRYVLLDVEEQLTSEVHYAKAVPWPLASDPQVVAVANYGGAYDPLRARRFAAGADANQLRMIRSRSLAGEIAPAFIEYIPIEQPNGSRYQLYVSDSIPLEDKDGLLPFAVTE